MNTKPLLKSKPLNWVDAASVQPREVKFLWAPYVPYGAVTLVFGEGGIGKSWITGRIAADLSQGRPLPGMYQSYEPQKVLIISAEDDLEKVVVPRLISMDANLSNITLLGEAFMLDAGKIEAIEEAMRGKSATVLFLDPLVSYLGGQMDMHRANETRTFMDRLNGLAKNQERAIIAVHHVKKQEGGSDMSKALGSVDFGNAIRSGLYVARGKTGKKFIRHAKSNWAQEGKTLGFNYDSGVFAWEEIGGEELTLISRTPRTQARDFLKQYLGAGMQPAQEVIKAGAKQGINERTLNRAKLGVARSRRINDVWWWELDGDVEVAVAKPVEAAGVAPIPVANDPSGDDNVGSGMAKVDDAPLTDPEFDELVRGALAKSQGGKA